MLSTTAHDLSFSLIKVAHVFTVQVFIGCCKTSTTLGPEDLEGHKTDVALVVKSLHLYKNMDQLQRSQPQWKCSDRGMGTGRRGSM